MQVFFIFDSGKAALTVAALMQRREDFLPMSLVLSFSKPLCQLSQVSFQLQLFWMPFTACGYLFCRPPFSNTAWWRCVTVFICKRSVSVPPWCRHWHPASSLIVSRQLQINSCAVLCGKADLQDRMKMASIVYAYVFPWLFCYLTLWQATVQLYVKHSGDTIKELAGCTCHACICCAQMWFCFYVRYAGITSCLLQILKSIANEFTLQLRDACSSGSVCCLRPLSVRLCFACKSAVSFVVFDGRCHILLYTKGTHSSRHW